MRSLLVACLCLSLTGGCRGRIQPMLCENVLRLRIGQSRAKVRALLGNPHFEVEERGGFGGWQLPDGSVFFHKADYVFFYGTQQSGQTVILGIRDEMTITFFDDRLVKASAYRMAQYGPEHSKLGDGFRMGPTGPEPKPTYSLGEDFDSMFSCRSAPALLDARKRFLDAGAFATQPQQAPSKSRPGATHLVPFSPLLQAGTDQRLVVLGTTAGVIERRDAVTHTTPTWLISATTAASDR